MLGGVPNALFLVDMQVAQLAEEVLRALERERAAFGLPPGARLLPAHPLAVSGGSDDGAFGAGLPCGWTRRAPGPGFKRATGVSTGSPIAPFAFLGPAWDPQLRAVYTGIRPADVFAQRGWLDLPFGESMADTARLFGLISRYADESMLDAIAGEYAKDRLPLVGTTNLDVQRPVMWNVGAIAASGGRVALDLIRRIPLAPAAVPALFPPVMIEAEADGWT